VKTVEGELESLGINLEMHVRIITEAALLGSILEHGSVNPELVIVSDDAGQFNICSMLCAGYTLNDPY
jgi:hypothetical protein